MNSIRIKLYILALFTVLKGSYQTKRCHMSVKAISKCFLTETFLGMMNYSARFIPNYATVCEPLRRLTQQGIIA